MLAELNQNDCDNLRLAIDKMKSVDFDAARKMELLLGAYEKQDDEDREDAKLRKEIEGLTGWTTGSGHLEHIKSVSDMLDRATTNILEWRGSKDDEPLDEAVKRLVQAAETPDPAAERMETALASILHLTGAGESEVVRQIRDLAAAALP